MIQHIQLDCLARPSQILGEGNIFFAGLRVTRRMIMDRDYASCKILKCLRDNFSDMRGCLTNSAFFDLKNINQAILAIQEQYLKDLFLDVS